jgi:hypothetical protein
VREWHASNHAPRLKIRNIGDIRIRLLPYYTALHPRKEFDFFSHCSILLWVLRQVKNTILRCGIPVVLLEYTKHFLLWYTKIKFFQTLVRTIENQKSFKECGSCYCEYYLAYSVSNNRIIQEPIVFGSKFQVTTMEDSNKLVIQLTLQKWQCRKEMLFLYFCISFQFHWSSDK